MSPEIILPPLFQFSDIPPSPLQDDAELTNPACPSFLRPTEWGPACTAQPARKAPNVIVQYIILLMKTSYQQITTWLKKPLPTRKPQVTVRSAYKYSVWSMVQELYHKWIQQKHLAMKNEGGSGGNNQCIDLYQQALTAFIWDNLTDVQLQATHKIAAKWNGPEGPSPEVQAW
ncbi:hypothetical protein EDD15DRAFT_2371504 [Pisolithus albus]|nr:hypothetical protein EDD15DRAFT_2371504 [Pisolithus albus]